MVATIPNYDRWQEVERLRAERNAVANKMKGKLEPSVRQALVEEGRVFMTVFSKKKKLKQRYQHSDFFFFKIGLLQART